MSLNFDILDLIPQRRPFVMVDSLDFCDSSATTTSFMVREENIFCRGGEFLEAGIMENVAQTCAARIGYLNRQSNQPVRIGIIGAVRDFVVEGSLPKAGEKLTTRMTVSSEVFGITMVDATVECEGREVARCNMKISLTDKQIEE